MLHSAACKGVLMCHTQTIKVTLRGAWVTPCKSVWTSNLAIAARYFKKHFCFEESHFITLCELLEAITSLIKLSRRSSLGHKGPILWWQCSGTMVAVGSN